MALLSEAASYCSVSRGGLVVEPSKGTMLSSVTHWAYQGQSPEDLKHLLFLTTLELESTRLAAKDDIKRLEENVRKLFNILQVTCRERDEAREQCQKLQEKIMQRSLSDLHSGLSNVQPDSPAGRSFKGDSGITDCDSISGTYKHHSFVSSPAQSMFDTVSSIQEPAKLNLTDSSSMDLLQQPYIEFSEEYHQSSFPGQTVQLTSGCNAGSFKNSKSQNQLALHQKSIRRSSSLSETHHCSYLSDELQNMEPHSLLNVSTAFADCNLQAEHQTSMQSCLALNAINNGRDVQCQQQDILSLQKHINEKIRTNQQHLKIEHHSPSEEETQDQATPQNMSECLQPENLIGSDKCLQAKDAKSCPQFSTESESLWQAVSRINTLEQMTPLPHESMVGNCGMTMSSSVATVAEVPPLVSRGIPKPQMNMTHSQAVSGPSSSMAQLKRYGDLPSVVPVHLPEPPESDPQVIMKSLPEKGKLLEAVMKAGPLLQTLLLAGPLPQWRHPPPTLDSFEIPLVSMSTSNAISPLPNPLQLNVPVCDQTHLVQNSGSVFCSMNQSNPSQIPVVAQLQSAASTSSSSNKRTLLNSSVNGHFVHGPRPPLKYAKLQ